MRFLDKISENQGMLPSDCLWLLPPASRIYLSLLRKVSKIANLHQAYFLASVQILGRHLSWQLSWYCWTCYSSRNLNHNHLFWEYNLNNNNNNILALPHTTRCGEYVRNWNSTEGNCFSAMEVKLSLSSKVERVFTLLFGKMLWRSVYMSFSKG